MTREKEYQLAASEYINSDAVRPENMQLAYGDFINGAKWADANPNTKENVIIPRWILDNAFNALRLNYNVMAKEGSESCLRRQTATSYNYLKLYLEKEQPTSEEIKRVTLNYIDGQIDK